MMGAPGSELRPQAALSAECLTLGLGSGPHLKLVSTSPAWSLLGKKEGGTEAVFQRQTINPKSP